MPAITRSRTKARTFDTYGHRNGGASADATHFIQHNDYVAIVVMTFDYPGIGIKADFRDALKSIGASAVIDDIYNTQNFGYALVGQKDVGEGNGFEKYQPGRRGFMLPFTLVNGVPEQTAGAAANVSALRKTVASDHHAMAKKVSQVSTSVDGNTATVEDLSKSVDGISAQRTIKAEANGVIAGIGLASGPNGKKGTNQSRIYFQADLIGFITKYNQNPKKAKYPLIVKGGDVVINTALIKKATIKSAQIKSVAANKVTASKLSAISAKMGTVTGGLFRTSKNGGRAEMGGSGNFTFWAGSGGKNFKNANFAVDNKGKVQMNQADVIDTLQLAGSAVTFPKIKSNHTIWGRGDISHDKELPKDGWKQVETLSVEPKNGRALVGICGAFRMASQDHESSIRVRLRRKGSGNTVLLDEKVDEYNDFSGFYSLEAYDEPPTHARVKYILEIRLHAYTYTLATYHSIRYLELKR